MKNSIDGLPASYDHNYVIKTEKKCVLCKNLITNEEIESNRILCTEGFDFLHNACVEKNGFEAVFSRENDRTSMIKIRKR